VGRGKLIDDGQVAALVGLDRDLVDDMPGGNAADRDRAGGLGDGFLFAVMHALFQVLHAGGGGGLRAEADTGGDGAICCHRIGDGGAADAGASAGTLGKE
jgi:hypothetical protein